MSAERRFLALIPHRDCVAEARLIKRALFARGCAGAWSFPALVPLALVSAPLSVESLRGAGAALRESGPADGVFRFEKPARLTVDGGLTLFGCEMACAPGLFSDALRRAGAAPFESCLFALGCAEGARGAKEELEALRGLGIKALMFRAAACANMVIEALPAGEPALSFRWKTGKPAWLANMRQEASK